MSTDLARKIGVRELVDVFEQSTAAVHGAFGLLAAAEERLNAAFAMGEMRSSMFVRPSRYAHHGGDWTDSDQAIEQMTRQAWNVVVERLELRRVMSIAAWDEMDKQLREGVLPSFTFENICQFAEHHAGNLHSHLTDAVREVYDWLRPEGSSDGGQYVTNRHGGPVGKRVVLRWMVSAGWGAQRFHIRYGKSQHQLVALENVFSALDGMGQISKGYYSLLEVAINASDGAAETEYFKAKCCKNGNLHVEFKRLDLLARFNALAGGKNFKRATDSRPQSDSG